LRFKDDIISSSDPIVGKIDWLIVFSHLLMPTDFIVRVALINLIVSAGMLQVNPDFKHSRLQATCLAFHAIDSARL
jgi:hypothetical protein